MNPIRIIRIPLPQPAILQIYKKLRNIPESVFALFTAVTALFPVLSRSFPGLFPVLSWFFSGPFPKARDGKQGKNSSMERWPKTRKATPNSIGSGLRCLGTLGMM